MEPWELGGVDIPIYGHTPDQPPCVQTCSNIVLKHCSNKTSLKYNYDKWNICNKLLYITPK